MQDMKVKYNPNPRPASAQLADFHVSDDGVGGKCGTLMKWDRDWGWLQTLFLMLGGVAPDGMRNGGTAACCNHEMRVGQKFSAQWPLGSAAGLSKNTQGVTCRVACAMQGQKR